MRKQLSLRGFSLLEVMIGTGFLAVGSYMIANYVTTERKMYSNVDKQRELVRLVQQNVIDLQARKLDELPLPGKCVARNYDLRGGFLSEQAGDAADAICTNSVPASAGSKVIFLSSVVNPTSVTYVPATYLKLPQHVPTVRQIRVFGGYRPEGSGMTQQISLTVYRR